MSIEALNFKQDNYIVIITG